MTSLFFYHGYLNQWQFKSANYYIILKREDMVLWSAIEQYQTRGWGMRQENWISIIMYSIVNSVLFGS